MNSSAEPDPARAADQPGPADAHGSSSMEWCAIAYERAGRQAEFQIVVVEKDGSRRRVGRSPSFRAPIFGALRPRGKAKAAHELLVSRLTAAGWRPVGVGDSWHELGFIRSSAADRPVDTARVTALRENGSVTFVAEQLDAWGNPSRLAVSAAFPAPGRRPVPSSEQAEAAHEELLASLRHEGWAAVGPAGPEWYSIALERSADERDRPRPAEMWEPEQEPEPKPGLEPETETETVTEPPPAPATRSASRRSHRRSLNGRPADIAALVERRDVDGLVEAARFEEAGGAGPESVDAGHRVREQAVLALGELGPDAGSAAVIEALHDPSDSVRAAAVSVLASRAEAAPLAGALSVLPAGSESRGLAFQAILEHSSDSVARAAVRALLRAPGEAIPSPQDVAFLHSLAKSDGARDPGQVVFGELRKGLSEDRSEVAERAEEILVALGPASTPALIEELQSDRSPERAASALGRIGDSRATQPLIRGLENPNEAVRVEVVAALGALRDPAVVEPLLRATQDPSFDVRAEASHALDHLGAAGVIFGMSAMLRSMVIDAVESVAEVPRTAGGRPVVAEIPAPAEPSKPSELWELG